MLVHADGSLKALNSSSLRNQSTSSKGHKYGASSAGHQSEAYASKATDDNMVVLLQIGFTGLALKLNTSDSAAKEKWLFVMRKENDQMVCNCLAIVHNSHDANVMHAHNGVSAASHACT